VIPPVGATFERTHRHGRRVLELVETLPSGTLNPATGTHCDRHRLRVTVDVDRARTLNWSPVGDEFWVEDEWFANRTDFKRIK
jgi:hypothetical protein